MIAASTEDDRLLAAALLEQLSGADLQQLASLPAGFAFQAGVLGLQAEDGGRLTVDLRASHGRPPLLRAALAGRSPRPHVADATAGLGGDAFDLASAGCRVTAFERDLVPWLLLSDGLRRAARDPERAAAAARLRLLRGDALQLLAQHGPFDVVCLDPLFQGGKASAGKRRSMRLLHELSGAASDEAQLLRAAQQAARLRVSVKRPQAGDWLAHKRPSGSLSGRTIRFDLYPGLA